MYHALDSIPTASTHDTAIVNDGYRPLVASIDHHIIALEVTMNQSKLMQLSEPVADAQQYASHCFEIRLL